MSRTTRHYLSGLLILVLSVLCFAWLDVNRWLQAQDGSAVTRTPNVHWVYPSQGINVRHSPIEASDNIIASLPFASWVEPIGRSQDGLWVLILSGDIQGWVWRDYVFWQMDTNTLPVINQSGVLTPFPVTPGRPTITPNVNWVEVGFAGGNIRSEPDGIVISEIYTGDVVEPLALADTGLAEWVYVMYRGEPGWLRRDLARWQDDAAIDALPTLSLPVPTIDPGQKRQNLTAVALPATATNTPTATLTPSATLTPTITPTYTPSLTPTPTNTPTFTATATDTPAPTATATHTDTPTATQTPAPTLTWTPTPTASATNTPTPLPPTDIPTDTATATWTPSPSWTPLPTDTATPPPTATSTATDALTPTPTALEVAQVPTNTPEPPTWTPTLTETPTTTASPSPTWTPIPSDTPDLTGTVQRAQQVAWTSTAASWTATPTTTQTVLPSLTPSATEPPSSTPVPSDTATSAPTDTHTPEAIAPQPTSTPATPDSLPASVNTPTSPTDVEVVPTEPPSPSPAPTASPTVAPTVVPTEQATVTPLAIAAGGDPDNPDENVPVPGDAGADPESVAAPISGAEDDAGLPIGLIAGIALALGALAYVGLFVAQVASLGRYHEDFVLSACPVCETGQLYLEERRYRVLGIPRARRVMRCDQCRSVLRQVGRDQWRYAIDGAVNPNLFYELNGAVLTEEDLLAIAPEYGGAPPEYIEDDPTSYGGQ